MNFVHTLKRIFSDKGLLLTLVLSLTLLFCFYGKLLRDPCSTYFGVKGDGMQIYYETLYHTKYDTEFWKQKSINYPYGESIFYTGAMPFVNNTVKIFGPSAAPLGVGLINLMMLFSPVIGALFLYAIFRHLRLPWHYGAVAATGIAFLSPQMLRYSGHYSLTWVFLIPALLYLLLRFYDYPSLTKSFVIAFIVFLGTTTHIYFLVFFAAIGGIYWAMLFLTRDRGFGRIIFVLKHAGIQFLLPVIVFELLVMMSDQLSDRTAAPWGYLYYHSNNSGVFFPFGKPYEFLFKKFFEPDTVEFEGIAYVGLAAMCGILAIVLVQLYRLFRGRIKLLLAVTDHKALNIFFWTSVFLLWISYGNPFVEKHEDWLPYLGPLRQFRAIGRFNWVFFYVINIIAVYRIYKISQRKNFIRLAVLFLIPAMLMLDACYTNKGQQDLYNNKIAALEDVQNNLPENKWLQNFNPENYQAILPLPYFHTGSENVARIPRDPEIILCTYIVSLKTGLPMMSVVSGRVSLGQTLKSIPIVLDPVLPVPVLKDLPDNRPLLLIVRDGMLDENERRLVSLAKPIGESKDYNIYSLLPEDISEMINNQFVSIKNEFDSTIKFQDGKFLKTDSLAGFIYRSYDELKGKPFSGQGAFTWKIHENNIIIDTIIKQPGNYLASFWFKNIDKDIYPRCVIEVYANDGVENVTPYYLYTNPLWVVKAIQGEWGLLEFPINTSTPDAHVRINMWNKEMKKNDSLVVDELLIHPEKVDIYSTDRKTISKNNRTYFPR